MPGASAPESNRGQMAQQIFRGECRKSTKPQGARTGASKSEAQSNGRRANNDHRAAKKNSNFESTKQKRQFVDSHIKEYGSIAAACKKIDLAESTYHYKGNGNLTRERAEADARD
jgi:hypothetical protein